VAGSGSPNVRVGAGEGEFALRFDEAPKIDSCLGSGTVAVIAALAFRRAAACAVEATNGPAVQSLRWTQPSPPAVSDFLEYSGTIPLRRPAEPPADRDFLEVGVRISVGLGEIDAQVTLLIEGMGLARWDPEPRAGGGQRSLFCCLLFFVV